MADRNNTPAAPQVASTRRALLTGPAAVGAAAALPTLTVLQPASAAGADAELLALCAAWRRAFDREAAVTDRLACKFEKDWSGEEAALWHAVQDAVSELERRIFATRARTMAGVRAKAGVLAHLDAAAGIPAEREQAASLVADVLALGGAA